MTHKQKITDLQRLLDKSKEIVAHNSSDATFKAWKDAAERTLTRIFGVNSTEVQQFKKLRFFYHSSIMIISEDYSQQHREAFNRDFSTLLLSIKNFIEELSGNSDEPDDAAPVDDTKPKKIFISHSTQDVAIVELLIDVLESIGLTNKQIFCTSLAGYGINLGENFLDAIKNELSNDPLVLFVLSKHFYDSPVSLCEMGAAWVLTSDHIPILIPPFDFKDVKGVFPVTQGFKINNPPVLNLLKAKVEGIFDISPLEHTVWERKRNRIIKQINDEIEGWDMKE